MILGEFVPPGAKWYMWGISCRQGHNGICGDFRAARGIMVYVGISCRQGHNGICGEFRAARGIMVYVGDFVPPGAKWYMWGFSCRQGPNGL
jgi:hypothetical protein